MKCKLHTLLCLSLLFVFSACGQDDDPIPPLEGNRTVLVYIVADNNGLEESYNNANFATRDIDEMMQGMKSVDTSVFNLLVYLDANDTPSLFRITKDKKGKVTKEIIREYEEQVSTDVSVMNKVMQLAFSNYPADSYGLVYWSHGEGWIPYPLSAKASTRWIGQDRGEGDDRMNISDLQTVLDAAPHFDFIMFDACFMMSVEVAYELRSYTDYYIGSPTENPGPGAPYHKIVPLMFRPNAAVNMAMEYFNYYEANYDDGIGNENSNWTGGTSITVLKTNELENLAAATNQVLSGVSSVDNIALRNKVFNYDKRFTVGYYDMQDIVEELTDAESFAIWKKTFDSAKVYWNTTPKNYSMSVPSIYLGMFSMEGTNGVTHYIPDSSKPAAAAAYRSTAWYEAAGLSKLGW